MKNKEIQLKNLIAIALLLFGAALVVLQTNPLDHLPGRDGGYYLYAGDQILDSQVPYQDFWDHKPPMMFYTNALALMVGRGTQWGIFVFEYIAIAVSAVLCYLVLSRKWGATTSVVATGLGLYMLTRFLGEGNYSEEFALLFNSIAFFLFFRHYLPSQKKWVLFLIGCLAAVSFLYRPNNIGMPVGIFLAVGLHSLINKKVKFFLIQAGIGLGGFLSVFGVFSIYFLVKGLFYEMLEASVLYNFLYAGKSGFSLNSFVRFFNYIPALTALLLIGLIYFIFKLVREIKNKDIQLVSLFAITAMLSELILSTLSGRGFNHYYIGFFPIVAFSLGYLFSRGAPEPQEVTKKDVINFLRNAVFIALVVMAICSSAMSDYVEIADRLLFHRELGIEKLPEVSVFLDNNTEDGDTVLIWGAQLGLNYFSETVAPSKYSWYPLYVESDISEKMYAQYYDDLADSRPEYIVDAYIHSPDQYISLDKGIQKTQLNKANNDYYLPSNIDQVLDFIYESYEFYMNVGGYDVYIINDN